MCVTVGVVVAAAAVLAVIAGCTPPQPVSTLPSTGTDIGTYTAHADGSVEATGYVGRSDLEGGFWALYDRPLGPSSVNPPKILAVLLSGSVDQSAISAMDGVYVRIFGRLSTGTSIRMAGPEVFVDGIADTTNDEPK
jgi:hypothetical protein